MWIWGSRRQDGLRLYLPGILAIILAFSLREDVNALWFLIFGFCAKELIDSGHVYVTIWRTYLHGEERARSRMYLYGPPAIFAFFFAWCYFGWPYLGHFIIYATLFHNMRQFYGISKWYQRLNRRARRSSDYFFYFMTVWPIFTAHFRTEPIWTSYYTNNDVFLYPHAPLFQFFLTIFLAGACAWLSWEIRVAKRDGRVEWNRIFATLFPSALYSISFLLGRTQMEVLAPLVVSHGVSYILLVSLSVQRTYTRETLKKMAVPLVALTAVTFGIADYLYAENFFLLGNPGLSAFAALYLTPLFCHYLFDAVIWRKDHPQAALVYRHP